MRRIVWTQSALADFEQAVTYIAAENAPAARLVAQRVRAALSQMAEMATGRPGRVVGTYEKSVLRTPYIIAFAVSDSSITVLRVIHGRRDWPEGEWPS